MEVKIRQATLDDIEILHEIETHVIVLLIKVTYYNLRTLFLVRC
jgi:hypothetical protein